MESLYEKIKDLDCYDFRIFYLKAHHCYKKLGNPEEAKAYIDKSIEAIPLIKEDIFSIVENSLFVYVPLGNNRFVPVAGVSNKQISNTELSQVNIHSSSA